MPCQAASCEVVAGVSYVPKGGEKVEDLQPFDAEAFVDGILST